MKIGIITFHWATNYGAILQAYALKTYLTNLGHEVCIINYRPNKYKITFLSCFFTPRVNLYLSHIKEYIKEQKLERFRKKYLNETVLYKSAANLKKSPPLLDVFIAGSDQVWNPYFTQEGEGGPTTAYFLDFGNKNVKRIGYAVSFGCEVYPATAEVIAKKYMENFQGISVRENSGLKIVKNLGFNNPIILLDPTLLLKRDAYNFENYKLLNKEKYVLVYILRNENKNFKSIISHLSKDCKVMAINKSLNPESIEMWIEKIRNSSFVITNSFHGMVFSLIFHVPFVITLTRGVGMNDRFYSLLSKLNLQNRIVYGDKTDNLQVLLEEEIDWQYIDTKLSKERDKTANFFKHLLS